MNILAIDHVQIAMPVGGEELARGFYGAALGLEEKPKPPVLAKRGGAWFEQGDIKIHLGVEANFKPAKKAHACFVVKDLSAMEQKMKHLGFDVTPDSAIAEVKRFFTADPFGNRIEIMEMSENLDITSTRLVQN